MLSVLQLILLIEFELDNRNFDESMIIDLKYNNTVTFYKYTTYHVDKLLMKRLEIDEKIDEPSILNKFLRTFIRSHSVDYTKTCRLL